MIINIDDLNYIILKTNSGRPFWYYNDNASKRDSEFSWAIHNFSKYVLHTRLLEAEPFLDTMSIYYLYRYCSDYNTWPETEEKIRRNLFCKELYEKTLGTKI